MPGPEWHHFPALYGRLGAPLRPSPSDVANFRQAIRGHDARVLLLGVTPSLAELGERLVAIDGSPEMIATIWPGDRENRRAIVGPWTALPFEDSTFDAVIGDGSLNSSPSDADRVLGEVERVLAPGGTAAFRLFCAPDQPEDFGSIERDAMIGAAGNIHALKWRIGMMLAASNPDAIVTARAMLGAFNAMFSDRAQLAAATGWSREQIETLDAYVDADHSLGFSTLAAYRAMAASLFPKSAVSPNAGYPLAERCPTLILEKTDD